jgi:hypothetical protein
MALPMPTTSREASAIVSGPFLFRQGEGGATLRPPRLCGKPGEDINLPRSPALSLSGDLNFQLD